MPKQNKQIKQKIDINEDMNVSIGDLLKKQDPENSASQRPTEDIERARQIHSGYNVPDINDHDCDIKKMIPKFGKISLQHQRAGRGGKTVTLISISGGAESEQNLEHLVRELKKSLGCGGQVEEGKIALQGDIADRASEWFTKMGAKSVKNITRH